ncbi:MAG: regulatory protein RecX [Solirubrobacteraceae bacterium]
MTSRRWRQSETAKIEPPETTEAQRLQRGLELGFAFLNRRERTTDELRRQLERKGVGAETAEACLREFQERGYVDDARYALMFVHDKRELEGWGSERIRRGLADRGLTVS